MQRIASSPRANWQERVEAAGLTWHTGEHEAYWNESAFYEFTAKEVDLLASATNELEEMMRKADDACTDWKKAATLGVTVAKDYSQDCQ